MTEFILSISIFFLLHLIPPIPALRQRLINVLGRRTYLTLYSIASIAALAWVISASFRASQIVIWTAAPWQAVVTLVFMPVSLWFLITGIAANNPLSISLRRREVEESLAPTIVITRHPVLWGFAIWAGSHIPPNGDLVSLILFGMLTALSVMGFKLLDFRARRRLGSEQWMEISRCTSIIPFVAVLSNRGKIHVDFAFLSQTFLAVVVYVWFVLYGHGLLFGAHPLAWLS